VSCFRRTSGEPKLGCATADPPRDVAQTLEWRCDRGRRDSGEAFLSLPDDPDYETEELGRMSAVDARELAARLGATLAIDC
jgi:hypothetical protein